MFSKKQLIKAYGSRRSIGSQDSGSDINERDGVESKLVKLDQSRNSDLRYQSVHLIEDNSPKFYNLSKNSMKPNPKVFRVPQASDRFKLKSETPGPG
jgi:hypothetical protein